LVKDVSYSFEGAPYVFNTRGTMSVPKSFCITPESKDVNVDIADKTRFNFDIISGETHLNFSYKNMRLGFEMPVFSYRFEGEEWNIMRPDDVWHTDFKTLMQVKYSGDRITFFLDDRGEDDADEHIEEFSKIKSKNIFECDLNRFKSWFGREHTARKIYVSLPGDEKPRLFQQVVTKSLLVSALLTAVYMMTIVMRAFYPSHEFDVTSVEHVYDPGWKMSLPIIICATLTVLLGLFSTSLVQFLSDVAAGIY
jgi:hypothetical protein